MFRTDQAVSDTEPTMIPIHWRWQMVRDNPQQATAQRSASQ
jgi:hypothetical protein